MKKFTLGTLVSFLAAACAFLQCFSTAAAEKPKTPPEIPANTKTGDFPRKRLNPPPLQTGAQRAEGILDELSSGVQSPPPKPAATETDSDSSLSMLPNTMEGLNDKRPLGIGDKLSFKVVEDELQPRMLFVTDSNEVEVPYIGRISVGNRNCKEFAYYIKKLLEKEYYYQATVIVGLDSAGNSARAVSRGKVYVMGQVRSPGAQEIPVDEAYTLTTAILRAGGFGPYANKRKVKLVRGGKSGGGAKPIIVDCVEIMDKANWNKDVEVNPGDIITVPEKLINIF